MASSFSLKWIKYEGFVKNNDIDFIEASLSSRGLPNEKKQKFSPNRNVVTEAKEANYSLFPFLIIADF